MTTYYTDGSCSPNPGPGGFAVIKAMQPAILGAEAQSTNIRMEGKALIAAMQDANGQECQIYTDSEFWVNVITKWSVNWEKNGWKKKGGEIKNLDIVKEATALYRASKATLTWVRGHADDPGNILADEWANTARERFKRGESLAIENPTLIPETAATLVPRYLDEARSLQLATVREGSPWICTVHYVFTNNALYWLSLPTRRHSQEIAAHPKTAVAIAVKTNQPVVGVQAEGMTVVVTDSLEVAAVLERYIAKYQKGQDFVKRFAAGTNEHQLYKFTTQAYRLFDELHFAPDQAQQTWTL